MVYTIGSLSWVQLNLGPYPHFVDMIVVVDLFNVKSTNICIYVFNVIMSNGLTAVVSPVFFKLYYYSCKYDCHKS